jgi:hypothetical protein
VYLRYFPNDFEIVPVAAVIAGISHLFLHSTCDAFTL